MNTPTSWLGLGIAGLALLSLSSCQSRQFSGNSLLVAAVTTGPSDLTMTVAFGEQVSVTGMRVDTVGQSTVVTRVREDRARRFILPGLVGYRGLIGLHSVDLVLGETTLWIDDTSVKMYGPAGSVDLALQDAAGDDVFGGRDLILTGNNVQAAAPDR